MGIGRRLRELRERACMTQEELAELLGVTPSAVGNYERDVSHPKEEVLYRLFSVLGAEPNDIFRDCYTRGASPVSAHLEKYRELDTHGRELVDACTEIELRRCAEGKVLAAARGGGSPRVIEMKKRPGAGSILDEPDYNARGGRR